VLVAGRIFCQIGAGWIRARPSSYSTGPTDVFLGRFYSGRGSPTWRALSPAVPAARSAVGIRGCGTGPGPRGADWIPHLGAGIMEGGATAEARHLGASAWKKDISSPAPGTVDRGPQDLRLGPRPQVAWPHPRRSGVRIRRCDRAPDLRLWSRPEPSRGRPRPSLQDPGGDIAV